MSTGSVDNQLNKADITSLFANFTLELTPKIVMQTSRLGELLDRQHLIYVTYLPTTKASETLDACEHLLAQGFQVRPHIAARSIESDEHCKLIFTRLQELGIRSILLIAGAVKIPKGPYTSTQSLLERHDISAYGIQSISFAGHPEGNPDISSQEIIQAERLKQEFVTKYQLDGSFTTQFCFEALPVLAWIEHLRISEMNLAVNVGIPGVVSTKSLLKHAQACGVGPSINYLLGYRRKFRQLLSLNTPDRLIYDLAMYKKKNGENTLFKRLHFFPFGGLTNTIAWINHIRRGEFEIHNRGLKVYE